MAEQSPTFQRIVEWIESEDGDIKVSGVCPELGYVDVAGKVGKGSLGPLADEGIVVVAVNSDISELEADEMRVWFEKSE